MSLKKLTRAFEKLPADFDRMKETLRYAVNPDHRHDEAWEQAADAKRTAIADSHRYQSFAAERDGCEAKFFIDGHDYFYALSESLENAQELICITGWWITPELYLRRPPALNEQYRLDRLLLRKAQQGVKICIVVYKEVQASMSMSSQWTKHALEDLHENISVMRHPDHFGGGEVTMFWSHHEKIVIVDNVIACIGGLDICFGRWDTHNASIADVFPTDFARTVFPGQDYNNARVKDFHDVQRWIGNQVSRLDTARMPWHDVHSMIAGPAVMDIAQHFVERWNFVRGLKYNHNRRYLHLAFPHLPAENDNPPESIVKHPHLEQWKEIGRQFVFHAVKPELGGHVPFGGLGPKGNMRIQALRSSADWSSGILTEHSIQNAYCQLISEASHFIYIENQFFVTNSVPGKGDVKNLIGQAIVARVLSAARANKVFKVVIVIPAIPGFSGDLQGNGATLAIMWATYQSICRGGDSIMELIAKEGFDPSQYISVYSLRSFDRINNDPARLRSMEKKSGVSFDEAQAALGRVFLGRDAAQSEVQLNSHITFQLGQEGGESLNAGMVKDDKSQPPTIQLALPQSYDEAIKIIHCFQAGTPLDETISDTIAHHVLQSGGSLLHEPWYGTEESERQAYVQEELYIHTKCMIVDDRRVIIGSANLNDRSQLGDRDSEIALVIEDQDSFDSTMDGKPFVASRFAASLRRQLWKQHLGLIAPQFTDDPVNPAMRPVGTKGVDTTASREDSLVTDPIACHASLWQEIADVNTQVFDDVFHVVPCKEVEDWQQYQDHLPKQVMVGHVHSKAPMSEVKQQLSTVRGHLVNFPLNFLKKENLLEVTGSVNPVTMPLYV